MKIFAIRLKPNDDLKQNLKNFAIEKNIQAGFILSGIGSLKQATIRFANQDMSTVLRDKFEILSLNGTIANQGLHLHIAIANQQGQTIGGQQEEKGQGAGSKGENRDGACTPPRSSALEGRGLYPCSAPLHAGRKGLLPLLPAPFPPASSGHLDNGCVIYTTAEIVIGATEEFRFQRTVDEQTGYQELEIQYPPFSS
ncbi:MAG TPA: PPC domain-containing DNA-binding protein [Leptolyngbyaceae cyanobacterium]